MPRSPVLVALTFSAALLAAPAAKSDAPNVALTIKDHQFVPAELHIPAREKVVLVVKNLDATPSEFESTDLNREKVVVGGGSITVFIGPLRPGTYEFFDDFNPNTRHGHIIAR
jgi:Cupredoxin-like domain